MTRVEATYLLNNLRSVAEGEEDEAIDMAIEALSVANLKEKFESADAVQGVGRYENAMQKLRDMPRYLNGVKEKQITKISADDVVRCKDCRWYEYSDVCHNPRYGDGHANYQPPYVDEDYWCKDGKRKGGDTE